MSDSCEISAGVSLLEQINQASGSMFLCCCCPPRLKPPHIIWVSSYQHVHLIITIAAIYRSSLCTLSIDHHKKLTYFDDQVKACATFRCNFSALFPTFQLDIPRQFCVFPPPTNVPPTPTASDFCRPPTKNACLTTPVMPTLTLDYKMSLMWWF